MYDISSLINGKTSEKKALAFLLLPDVRFRIKVHRPFDLFSINKVVDREVYRPKSLPAFVLRDGLHKGNQFTVFVLCTGDVLDDNRKIVLVEYRRISDLFPKDKPDDKPCWGIRM